MSSMRTRRQAVQEIEAASPNTGSGKAMNGNGNARKEVVPVRAFEDAPAENIFLFYPNLIGKHSHPYLHSSNHVLTEGGYL